MRRILLLLAVLLLAFFVRLYQVQVIPVSLYWDEVAIGYNAYAVSETGKDEYGSSFPLLFRSFDDYKLPGQVYLTAPFVKILGLSELAVRLPAVLMGTLAVLATYAFTLQLFSKRTKLALLSGFFLAISPWHIHFTRASFEAGSALTLLIAGAACILKGLKARQLPALIIGILLLAGSTYFYRSAQVFAPLLVLGLLLFSWKKTILSIKKPLLVVVIFSALVALIYFVSFFGVGNVRINQVGVASETFDQTVESAKLIEQSGSTALSRIIYNRRFIYALQFAKNYAAHFNPNFLFWSGDPFGRHQTPGMGQLYFWEIITLPLGLLGLWLFSKKKFGLLSWWVVSAIVPAALASPSPHALRSLNILPIPQILSAWGIIFVSSLTKSHWAKLSSSLAIAGIIAVFLHRYLSLYFILSPSYSSFSWGDPNKELVAYLTPLESKYDKVIVTGFNWQPYIYFLFYQKVNPKEFQNSGTSFEFKKYWFGSPDWDPQNPYRQLRNINLADFNRYGQKLLFVLSEEEYKLKKSEVAVLREMRAKNSRLVFVLAQPITTSDLQ